MEGKKDCLFQFATRHKVFVDTDLITRTEANRFWNESMETLKENWDEYESPQMCLWIECTKNTDYHTVGKEIDFRDCVLENGHFYRVTKEKIA